MSGTQEQLTGEHLTQSANLAPTNVNTNTTIQSNGQFEAPVTSGASTEPKQEETLKKPDEPAKIKRPMNPFMIFGCEKRRKLAQVHPRMHNSEISKILGAEWKRMSEYEKAPYVQEAKRLKEQHSIEYPNYKFKANRRKPRQSVKKERPTFPYAEPNAIPAMKFPYPSPFFQDPSMYSLYAMPGGSHPAFPMYGNEYGSPIIRQGMTAGGATRAAQPPTTTAASGDYYSLNKGSVAAVNDYYPASNKSSEYYAAMHPTAVAAGRSERNATSAEVVNLSDRYNSADNRQFDRSYASTFNGSQGSSVVTYTTMQNMSHLSNETPTAYSYTSLYEPRH